MPQCVVVKAFNGEAITRWISSVGLSVVYITDLRGLNEIESGFSPSRKVGFPFCDIYYPNSVLDLRDGDEPDWGVMKSLNAQELPNLKRSVEAMHECEAEFEEMEHVKEQFEGELVWEGDVARFTLAGHPTAGACYAWSSPIEGSEKRRVYAVLQIAPVESATDAVRASIVRDNKEEGN